MKLIYVHGDDDYGALYWEQLLDNKKQSYIKKLKSQENKIITIEDEGGETHIELLEFDAVDPKFISFIRSNIQDYDISKARDFFVIED